MAAHKQRQVCRLQRRCQEGGGGGESTGSYFDSGPPPPPPPPRPGSPSMRTTLPPRATGTCLDSVSPPARRRAGDLLQRELCRRRELQAPASTRVAAPPGIFFNKCSASAAGYGILPGLGVAAAVPGIFFNASSGAATGGGTLCQKSLEGRDIYLHVQQLLRQPELHVGHLVVEGEGPVVKENDDGSTQ